MIEYDASVLKKYATALYIQAYIEIFVFTIAGLFIGYCAGRVIAPTLAVSQSQPSYTAQRYQTSPLEAGRIQEDHYHDKDSSTPQYIGLGVFGFLGLFVGVIRSYGLRIKAQQILCQVAIEANTSARTYSLPANR
jgi:hypothetical protein